MERKERAPAKLAADRKKRHKRVGKKQLEGQGR